jgi:hypothetical protein
MYTPKSAVLLYDTALYKDDAKQIETILFQEKIDVHHVDIREPHVKTELQIHLHIPVYSAVSWAYKNILLVHPDKWIDSYKEYHHAFKICYMKDDWATVLQEMLWVEHGELGTPILHINKCPPISIVTPTYHRKHLIDIAFHNMLATDYPLEKIEWIIVEDNEVKENMATDKIVQFQIQAPTIRIKYIPIEGRLTIGEKRNIGVKEASHDIILFMDDDDHYPTTSFRRRVAWLSRGDIVCCSTLPLYDLKLGTSAVSIPPFELPLCQRISEATLTFRKSMWEERPFLDVSISEAEAWIKDRESAVIEIPPQQIIIAFTHGNNQSSRVVPGTNPSCFWGFPKEYLTFIHGLVGVQVE